MRLFGSIKELVSAVFRKDTWQITLKPNDTEYVGDVTLELPPNLTGADVLVSETASQPLTNKTIDADSNTVTNIDNGNIKAGAAIDATKIADGSVTSTEFQYLGNVTSDIQNQLDNRQPLDSDLTAIAALSTTGLISRTASGTAATRTITANSSKIAITNGDGVSGNPTVDVTEANLTLDNIGGILSKSKGGAGADMSAVTFPSTGTIVTRTASESLSNKTLDNTNLIDGSKLSNTQVRKGTDGTGTSQLRFYNDAGTAYTSIEAGAGLGTTYSLRLPNTLPASVDSVLTNDGTGASTWRRLTDSSVASAVVVRDAFQNFSANIITATLNGNATNVTGTVATANGGTGVTGGTATFPSSGVVVTQDATETLLNKTTISSTSLATGALTVPTGTSAERPTPNDGMIRYNTDNSVFEGRVAGSWVPFAASLVSANSIAPVGSIIAYNPGYYTSSTNGGFTLVGPATNNVAGVNAFLPDNWRVCDGSLAYNVDSPIWNMEISNNRRVPNLTTSRFLMGSTSAGTAADQDTATGSASVSWVSTAVNTTGGAATFDKSVMNTNQTAHSHAEGTFITLIEIDGSYLYMSAIAKSWTSTHRGPFAGAIGSSSTALAGGTAIDGVSATASATWTAGATVSTTFTQPTFNKTVMNTNQTAHSHTVDVTPNYLSTFYIIRIF